MKMNFRFATIILAIFAVAAFSSCEDLSPTESNRAKMVGNWTATAYSQTNCNDATDNAALTFDSEGFCTEAIPGTTTCIILTYQFAEEGSFIAVFNTINSIAGVEISNTNETLTGTWEVLDATRMTVCADGDCSTGTYVVTNSTLVYNGTNTDNGCDVSFSADKQ